MSIGTLTKIVSLNCWGETPPWNGFERKYEKRKWRQRRDNCVEEFCFKEEQGKLSVFDRKWDNENFL